MDGRMRERALPTITNRASLIYRERESKRASEKEREREERDALSALFPSVARI